MQQGNWHQQRMHRPSLLLNGLREPLTIWQTAKLLELYATLIQNMPPPAETAVDWSNGAYVQITLFDEIAFDRYYPAFARHREHL
jgi:hypothetical protein